MAPSHRTSRALPLLLAALAALPATGCIGPFRRAFAPEQRVTDAAAAASCAGMIANQLGYVAADEPNAAPSDSTGERRFTAERRSASTEGTLVVDQLAVIVRAPEGTDGRARLKVVPARYVEDSRQAITPGRRVPRMRPPGPAEGAARIDRDGARRRRVDAGPARRDAIEVITRCAR
jgi:hypothetical protein